MSPIYNDDFEKIIKAAPETNYSVNQLFNAALHRSEDRFYLAILDLEVIVHKSNEEENPQRYLSLQIIRPSMIQQFCEYLSAISAINPADFELEKDPNFVRRLQMLAYSQFWEFKGVQRLLTSLIRIACGMNYEARILLDSNRGTASTFREMISAASNSGLDIANLLNALYWNQIRNAFAHGEFWFLHEWLTFQNYKPKRQRDIPSITLNNWDLLYGATLAFMKSLFDKRIEAEKKLKSLTPFPIDLPEFSGPFRLYKDKRHYWVADPNI